MARLREAVSAFASLQWYLHRLQDKHVAPESARRASWQGHLLPPFPDRAPTEPAANTSGTGAHWWLPSEAAPEADQPSAASRIGADVNHPDNGRMGLLPSASM